MLRFRIRSVLFAALLLSVLMYLVVEYGIKRGEDYRKQQITAVLEEVHGVEEVQITGFQDTFAYDIEEVRIRLENNATITLFYPDIALQNRLPIKSINGVHLACRDVSTGDVSHPDFGVEGEFQYYLELQIDGVGDLIAELNCILAFVESWPMHPDSTEVGTKGGAKVECWRY